MISLYYTVQYTEVAKEFARFWERAKRSRMQSSGKMGELSPSLCVRKCINCMVGSTPTGASEVSSKLRISPSSSTHRCWGAVARSPTSCFT